MKKTDNSMPGALVIAAKCEAIDKVTVEPMNEAPAHAYNPDIRTLRIFNWKHRLIKKSVKHLTEKINEFCDKSTNKPIFKPYVIFNPIKRGIWVYNEMQYDIIAN